MCQYFVGENCGIQGSLKFALSLCIRLDGCTNCEVYKIGWQCGDNRSAKKMLNGHCNWVVKTS